MNSTTTQLEVFYFTNFTNDGIEDYYVHNYYRYAHPFATLLAGLVQIVCAVVFAQRELLAAGPFFQYSLVNSIGAAVGMITLTGYAFSRCGPLCPEAYSYASQAYELYGVIFFCNALYFGGSLIQIAISTQLYWSITQKFKRLNDLSPFKVCLVFITVSFSLMTCLIFCFKVQEIKYVTVRDKTIDWVVIYQVYLDYSNSNAFVYFSFLFGIVSNKIFLIILIFINSLLYVELRKLLKNKMKLRTTFANLNLSVSNKLAPTETPSSKLQTSEKRAPMSILMKNSLRNDRESKRKTLIMVLWVSVVFSSSRFVFAIANLTLLLLPYSVYNWWANAFNLFYGACVYISYFYVYMRANRVFKKKFYELFFKKIID